MAFMLRHSIFFHIPKTGGTWIRKAIHNAGIPTKEIGPHLDPIANWHVRTHEVERDGYWTFTFVRHPLTWYRSFWAYRMEHEWRHDMLPDECMASEFSQFIRNVLDRCPGYLSRLYQTFAEPPSGKPIDFVGRQERLSADLIQALRRAGEQFEESKILQTSPMNFTMLQPVYPPKLRRALLGAEREVLERFGYDHNGD